jgi:hypothetical protein
MLLQPLLRCHSFAVLQGQVLSERPPVFGAAASAPAAGNAGQQASAVSGAASSPGAHTGPDASTDAQMEAHAAKMRSLPLDVAPELMVGLQDWSPSAV